MGEIEFKKKTYMECNNKIIKSTFNDDSINFA